MRGVMTADAVNGDDLPTRFVKPINNVAADKPRSASDEYRSPHVHSTMEPSSWASNSRTIVAGFPATSEYGGTSLVTIVPAAMMLPFPIVTPFRIVLLRPI